MVRQPRDLDERQGVAKKCCKALNINMTMVVDAMDDQVSNAYNANPDRLFLVDSQGRVAYKGGAGPFGYNPAELEQSLILLLVDETSQASSKVRRGNPAAR